jgi:hypothetical protein
LLQPNAWQLPKPPLTSGAGYGNLEPDQIVLKALAKKAFLGCSKPEKKQDYPSLPK